MRAVLAEQLKQAHLRRELVSEVAAHKMVHTSLMLEHSSALQALASEQQQRQEAESRLERDLQTEQQQRREVEGRLQRDLQTERSAQVGLAAQYDAALQVVANTVSEVSSRPGRVGASPGPDLRLEPASVT